MKRSKIIEQFNEKIRSINNDTSIFNTRKYILLDDAIKIVNDVFSERQTSTEANEQHDSKALHIADVIGHLTINDLEKYQYSITVPKITDRNINEMGVHTIYNKLIEKMPEVEWTNVEDTGQLVIAFRNMLITKEQMQIVIDTINDL